MTDIKCTCYTCYNRRARELKRAGQERKKREKDKVIEALCDAGYRLVGSEGGEASDAPI